MKLARPALPAFKFVGAILALLAAGPALTAQTGTVLVRHAPVLSGSVEGSVQVFLPESVALPGTASLTRDLLVPGTPVITVNGNAHYGAILDGGGSATPAGYTITLNGNATLRNIVRRSDAGTLPVVAAPPLPAGTRTVSLGKSDPGPGDFATLRNLTLNSNAGQVAVPAGTYGNFAASSNSGFILGVAGATSPAVYNFQGLTLSSNSTLQIAGPVVITLNSGLTVSANVTIGAAAHPAWLDLRLATGDFTLASNATAYASVAVPAGAITVNSGGQLIGRAASDQLVLNSNALLRANGAPVVALTSPAANSGYIAPAAAISLAATATPGDFAVAKVDFYAGATLLATDNTAPYQFDWTNVPAGTYLLTAVATDTSGASSVSAPVPILVNARPTVALTAPAPGTVFTAPVADLVLSATAADSDGSVARVDYYAGATLLGSATSSPYAFHWTGVPSGSYALTAVATDNLGATATSAPVDIIVNAPPTVALTGPANGSLLIAPVTLALTASATDSDGTVAQVDFYRGGLLLGTSTAAPYHLDLPNAPSGTYELTAVATDNHGATTTSGVVTVVVDAAPAVNLVAPAPGAVLTAPASFNLAASASDADGTVAKVEFFDGLNKLGEAGSAPYQLPVTGLAAGSYTFTARATDNLGVATVSAPVSILVNAPPSVTLTAPGAGSVFTAPAANITLSADAADADGAVTRVDFYQGATLLGTSTHAPFQFDWSNVPAGTYALKAVATDNYGATAASAPVSIVVNAPPTVTLTAPADGAVVTAPGSLTLAATAADTDGTVTRVDFYQDGTLVGSATAAPYELALTGLAAGSYTFTAVATDNRGATATSSEVSVTVNEPPTVALTAPADGADLVAPAGFNLVAAADDSDGSVTKVDFYQGATLVGTSTAAPYHQSVAGLPVGTYVFTAVATDDDGASTTSAPVNVTVHANHPPTVALTTPTSNAAFTAPASIALTAAAADDDGTVAKVDFYQGATLLGSANTAPFQFNWANVAAGSYSLTAVATDNLGATTTSAPVAVTVSNPAPATITFDSVSSATILTATTTLSWQHTLVAGPGSSRAVIVNVVSRGSSVAAASASGVTFNGVPMIAVPNSAANAGSGTFNRSQLFYLLEASLPAAGTYPVVVTFASSQSASNNPLAGAIALTNVSQTAPAGFNNSSGTGTANNLSTTVPASTGSWVVDGFGVGSTTANILTNATGMVPRYNVAQPGPNSGAAGSTKVADDSGSVTMAWKSATAREVHSLAVFAPALSVQTPPAITTQPATQSVFVGTNVNLTVAASGTAPLSYQWFKNGSPVSGATALTLNFPSAQTTDSGSYTVLVSNAVGSVTSNAAVLTVSVQPPAITTPPVSQSANLGDNISFSVAATGTAPLAYQWFKDSAPIGGATGATFALANVQGADAASYTVSVTNAAGSVLSSPAVLSVNTGPVGPTITSQPLAQNVGVGANVSFSVTATGTAPLAYQWQKNNVDIPLANGATLSLPNVQFGDAGNYRVVVSNAVASVTSNQAALTVNSLTSPSAIYNLTGFATAGTGTTGGGVIPETDPAYKKVSTPLDLANAINLANKTAGAVKVIEIMNDLDLGWNEIGATVQNLASNAFRAHNPPQLHPVLLVTGVSIIDIKPKNGLTIFSANGSTIRHATFNIKGASNIIVRNLRFAEMWEWDEATKGDYDKNDWDFIDLSNGGAVTNVWIDHCTFTKTYDGIVDMKAGTQYVTLSWCKYTGDDNATNPNSFVRQQITALEANRSAYAFYNFLRTNGFSVEDIITIQQGHDKTHLMGSNSLDAGNATLSATFHHQWFKDAWDRCVPRLRAGNVHNYNIYVDDTSLLAAKRMRDARANAMTTAARNTLNNTYSFNPPINGSISTEGGAILLENSVYIDCLTPLRNNQTDPTNPQYTGRILGLNTIYHMDNADGTSTDVQGNSTDAGSPLGPFQAPIISFSWGLPGNVLPYTYTPDDPATLLPSLQAGAGAGTITWSKDNWLKTSY